MVASPEPVISITTARTLVAEWATECGERLRARRTALGWDRRLLADRVGVSEATIVRIEQGLLNPRDHLKLAVAAALRVDAAAIWSLPRRARVVAAGRAEPRLDRRST